MLTFKFKSVLLGGVCAVCFAAPATAENFNIPSGDLENALNIYVTQTGVHLIVSEDAIRGVRSRGVKGDLPADQALSRILAGSGFTIRNESGVLAVVRGGQSSDASEVQLQPMHLAQAAPPRTAVETVTVTSSKLGGADVQSIPIAITALSQEQLTATQTAGGPDLVKQVPNLTFTKTNFTGYSIQIRGIGTQAISVTTDPAVAVAFNDIPFIRNHFFEQEFYDVGQVEVLRGPQGTLYGRNATAGVVNLTSAKPTDQFEAMASADIGNYQNRRFEAMLNLPIVDDRLDVRVAGEWTKRNGYSFNDTTNSSIDGRDLWSGRLTIGWKPTDKMQTYLVWEHFSEDDDRLRTSKQLCKRQPNPPTIGGVPVPAPGTVSGGGVTVYDPTYYLSQGCEMSSLYSADAFGVPNGLSLPYASALGILSPAIRQNFDPYASTVQSTDLRHIQSTLAPKYLAKNDVVELNSDYSISPELTFTSQTGFGQDFLWSTEDYNRFNTAPGVFDYHAPSGLNNANGVLTPDPIAGAPGIPASSGVFCDPQLGCSDKIVGADLSEEHAWQLSQEFRLASKFSGPLNFSVGGNYLHYETVEDYYVFINTLTLATASVQPGHELTGTGPWIPGVSDNSQCLVGGFRYTDPLAIHDPQLQGCQYIDPNPITSINGNGHNYFRSENPYTLNSYAAFGEAYYNVTPDVKLTGGLRWTKDQKHFTDIPSELLVEGYGYAPTGTVDQEWNEVTGRSVVNWTPKLDFTDQTLVYASYSHGYKAGGANPPGAVFLAFGSNTATGGAGTSPIHPATFAPEFVDAYELGTKNTLLDGSLTFNADVFYYNYKRYQISEIIDRTAINLNFDAEVKGAEIESTWEPIPGLRFNFAGGWEKTNLAKGSQSIDLMDRTASDPNYVVIKPFPTIASNCIFPAAEAGWLLIASQTNAAIPNACINAYARGLDPVTAVGTAPSGYPGFDPSTVPNNGQGIDKDLSGNELPNAPPFTISFGAQYTVPITPDWAGTLRGDYYWQDYSWARVFNDNPYDRLRGYTNVNLSLILTNQNGWQVMGYVKNIFNVTDITGAFLNSDDSGLTTNVFLTDPRLFGIRVTKNW